MGARIRVPRSWVETKLGLPAVCLYSGATEGVSYRAINLAARPHWALVINVPFAILIAYWSDLPSQGRWGLFGLVFLGYVVMGAKNPLLKAQLPISDRAFTAARVRRVVRFVGGTTLGAVLVIAFLVWAKQALGFPLRPEAYLAIYAGAFALNALERFLLVRSHEVRYYAAANGMVELRVPHDAAVAAIQARLAGTETAPPPGGAKCAVHGEQPAAFTCARCGSFACAACRHPAVPICAACVAHAG